jgi:hypothetical protein
MSTASLAWPPLFAEQDLPAPPLPAALASALQPLGSAAHATPGWPGRLGFRDAIGNWLIEPSRARAWAGIVGHGLRSTAVRLCLCGPDAGFFIQRHWSVAFGEASACQSRIEGAFMLLARIQAAVAAAQAAGRWPASQRLVLVDDDFDTLRWGWVEHGAMELPPLAVDPQAYLNILITVESLGAPTTAASH